MEKDEKETLVREPTISELVEAERTDGHIAKALEAQREQLAKRQSDVDHPIRFAIVVSGSECINFERGQLLRVVACDRATGTITLDVDRWIWVDPSKV